MKVRQAIGVIMGSIIGTSITGWIICLSALGTNANGLFSLFSTENLSAMIAVAGIVLRMFSSKQMKRHIGGLHLGICEKQVFERLLQTVPAKNDRIWDE